MEQNSELPGITREAEEEMLEKVIHTAQSNLEQAKQEVENLAGELHELLETYSEKDKEAMVFWNNTKASLSSAQEDLLRCQKARKKPYFGRIDFTDEKSQKQEALYIGRVGIKESAIKRSVIDWRAPVAAVYYENSLGPCSYSVRNIGTYDIELTRKRTYEIADDRLMDYYDSEVVANDDLLTRYLAKSKKAVLGEIIATIQKEQNIIIRKSPRNNIVVQGSAGSGKTTVAMHRISYILYNYENEFLPKDFYIVGSNRILLNYITSVLPDLDVYGIFQMTMEQLFTRLMYEDWDGKTFSIKSVRKGEENAVVKGTYRWFHDLEKFAADYEWEQIPHEDVITEHTKRVLLTKEEIETYIKENVQVSMQNKILQLNERIMARLENEICCKDISYTPEDKKEMRRFYKTYFGKKKWKGSIFEMYETFLKRQNEKGENVELPGNELDVYDLAALAYLYKRIKETELVREASHVVIDEAQDFGMMAYASLVYCLRDCTYTIMGDVSQNIHYGYGLNDWEELKNLVLKNKFDTFGLLKKSYRNTIEISRFATGILRHGTFAIYPVEPIIRHGNEVAITACKDKKQLLEHVLETIKNWQKEEHETIAVVCRDEEEAKAVQWQLQEKITLADSNLETAEFTSGVMVLPVEYTKGLEFDAVLLWNPSKEMYPANDEHVKLLYVAATRALHELAVLHTGDLTDLIGTQVSEEKKMNVLSEKQSEEISEKKKVPRTVIVQSISKVGKYVQKEGDILAGEERRTGPKRIAVQGQQKKEPVITPVRRKRSKDDKINDSPYQFGDVPDNSRLRPAGHGKIDTSVRFLNRNKDYAEIASSYGMLRITPVSDRVIRIRFRKGQMGEFKEVDDAKWITPQPKPKWACKETKDAIGIGTEKLLIQIEKKKGILKFFTREGKLLLAEREKDARQIEEVQVWNFFQWPAKEKLWARGLASEELMPMNMKARYISYGKRKLRMPFLVSDKGYGLAIAAERGVMCCGIPMYGTYISAEDTDQIDYYFMYGGSAGASLELYKMIRKN
ncbi:DNA helicase-2 / ATP-dependent DNA helicase PcrA [[Clostridium] polysaccharolyticum]|uniref:DNA helicase-2 / ATP-dependent DNA helicase PcrA n=2 Tax=[Clostridium] polysaccharolyticum TaxID=29364 RepID=A0A1I0ADI1_9FIRM|nr:DNA helicase-2 / ATP-dependent DNA helicase PcrA [[Clostridium] polysaccharolyticum]